MNFSQAGKTMAFFDLVLHLDSADPAMLRLVLRNASNYLNGLPDEKFALHIVANGGGATLFTRQHQDLHDLAHPLKMQGVVFKVCANALAEHGINHDDVWEGCEIVPAGLVEIVRLQRNGFAYIKP